MIEKYARASPDGTGAILHKLTAAERTGTGTKLQAVLQTDPACPLLNSAISLKDMEAGTGIEPVFTDLQSAA